MIRRPPISTLTDPFCPYTTLFRAEASAVAPALGRLGGGGQGGSGDLTCCPHPGSPGRLGAWRLGGRALVPPTWRAGAGGGCGGRRLPPEPPARGGAAPPPPEQPALSASRRRAQDKARRSPPSGGRGRKRQHEVDEVGFGAQLERPGFHLGGPRPMREKNTQ